jgi:exopolysaccharide biosynthesis polyprenyl glycosylphosphotransferase
MSIRLVAMGCRFTELALMIAAALATGLLIGKADLAASPGLVIAGSGLAIVLAIVILDRCGGYQLAALLTPADQVPLIVGAVTVATAIVGATILVFEPADGAVSLVEPLTWDLGGTALLVAFRFGLGWWLQRPPLAGRFAKKVAVIGVCAQSRAFIDSVADSPAVHIVGVFDDRDGSPVDPASPPVRGSLDALISYSRRYWLDALVIGDSQYAHRLALQPRLGLLAVDVFVTAPPTQFPPAAPGPDPLSGPSLIRVARRPMGDWKGWIKAAIDRLGSALLLFLTLPLLGLISLLVRLDSPGPVLFRQPREGLHGLPFTMFKFRTMANTPGDQFAQATRRDRRVTRTGYWLRRFSLDELPQLLNVLRGEMSLVGPRPHHANTRAGERLFADIVDNYHARHCVKPGLTGWAQVQGLRGETRTEQQIIDRVEHDLYYIENWSLGLDLRILWRTLLKEIVSRSGNAY